MARRPEPARARAVIIGPSVYADPDYEDRAEVRKSAEQIAALVKRSDVWGLDDDQVLEFIGEVEVATVARALKKVTRLDTDALLVYFCGHGIKYTDRYAPDQNLHMAFTDSVREWYFTHLPFYAVRRMLRSSKAAAKLLIIDCCYAKDSFLSGPGRAPVIDVKGVCTMIATKEDQQARAEWGETGYTGFSGALIEVIEKGIPGPEKSLTPHSVFQKVHSMLVSEEFPEPDIRGNANMMFLCDNNAYREPSGRVSYETLYRNLGNPGRLNLAEYTRAVAEVREQESRRPAAADGGRHKKETDKAIDLISAFCASREIGETWELATALRSGDEMSEYADEAISRILARSSAGDVAELVHLLHQQSGVDFDLSQVLIALRNRSGRDFVAVLRVLGQQPCADCQAITARLRDKIADTSADPKWLIDVLGAL